VNKKHAKAVRRRNKLKARKIDEVISVARTESSESGRVFGTPEFVHRFAGLTNNQIGDFTAKQLGNEEIALEQIPAERRERFRVEAERISQEEGEQVRFYRKPNGDYSMMF